RLHLHLEAPEVARAALGPKDPFKRVGYVGMGSEPKDVDPLTRQFARHLRGLLHSEESTSEWRAVVARSRAQSLVGGLMDEVENSAVRLAGNIECDHLGIPLT